MATRYSDRDYERRRGDEGRGFLDRASDEVRSWFGDEDAERRRRRRDGRDDERYEPERERSYERFRGIRARELMSRNITTVHHGDSIVLAARLMGECDCGALPVVDNQYRLVGMITDRDIVVRGVAHGKDPRHTYVHECMTDETFACHANDSLEGCMRQMSHHQVRRLPIVDDNDRVIGIISQSDLARHAGASPGRGERRAVADVLYEVSEPTERAYR